MGNRGACLCGAHEAELWDVGHLVRAPGPGAVLGAVLCWGLGGVLVLGAQVLCWVPAPVVQVLCWP